jgi:membrane fusion protein (multidrug efflux system)
MTVCRAGVIVGLMLLLGGCGRGADTANSAPLAEQPTRTEPAVPEVETAQPTKERLEASVDVPGTLIPDEEATVAAQANGPVTRVLVDAGSRVNTGTLLVQIDADKAALAVKQAEAGLAQAQANFAKAKGDMERKQILLEDRTIAPGTFESFKAQHDAAAAAVSMADATLALARQRLRELTVTAPFSGIVKEKRVSPGEYVREGDALIVVMRVNPIKLQFDLPEKYAGRVAVDHTVTATVTSLPGEEFLGRIRTVFPALDQATRSVRAEAMVANPQLRLSPGFYASVRVPLAPAPNAVSVPRSAVISREGTDNVFVVDDNRVRLVRVTTGVQQGDRIEILTGLQPTDRVVTAGGQTLTDGARVRVKG